MPSSKNNISDDDSTSRLLATVQPLRAEIADFDLATPLTSITSISGLHSRFTPWCNLGPSVYLLSRHEVPGLSASSWNELERFFCLLTTCE